MNPLLTAFLSFVFASGLVFALTQSRCRSLVQERLARITGEFAVGPPGGAKPEQSLRPDPLPTITRWLMQQEFEPRLRLLMLQADLRLRPAEWIAGCIVAALTGLILGLLAAHSLPAAVLLAALGAAVELQRAADAEHQAAQVSAATPDDVATPRIDERQDGLREAYAYTDRATATQSTVNAVLAQADAPAAPPAAALTSAPATAAQGYPTPIKEVSAAHAAPKPAAAAAPPTRTAARSATTAARRR